MFKCQQSQFIFNKAIMGQASRVLKKHGQNEQKAEVRKRNNRYSELTWRSGYCTCILGYCSIWCRALLHDVLVMVQIFGESNQGCFDYLKCKWVCAHFLLAVLYDECRYAFQHSKLWKFCTWLRRDTFVYAPSQWEMLLQCNSISHWPGHIHKIIPIYSHPPVLYQGSK